MSLTTNGAPINGGLAHSDEPKNHDKEALDGFATRAIHVGSEPDPSNGAVIPAICLSTTFKLYGADYPGKVRPDRRYERN
jgi:hypothetical protein